MKKQRKAFTPEQRKTAVEEFLSGKKTAAEIASSLGIDPTLIYRWKVAQEEASKGMRISQLEESGMDAQSAKKILRLEEEILEFKKKVGEQALIIDLLKKIPMSNSQSESELSGLIETMNHSARKRKPVK